MHTIVDGYNVLMVLAGCDGLMPTGRLEESREDFLRMLCNYRSRGGGKCTVVFDGSSRKPGRASGSPCAGIEVVFAAPPADADSVIKQMVEKSSNPSNVLVATSDRALRAHVKRAGAKVIGAPQFLRELAQEGKRRRDAEPPEKEHGLRDEDVRRWINIFGLGGKRN